jgi:hypothetical protein
MPAEDRSAGTRSLESLSSGIYLWRSCFMNGTISPFIRT